MAEPIQIHRIKHALHDFTESFKEFNKTISNIPCPDCKGTGKITLLRSVVDCDCKTQQRTCQECSSEYCECDGTCDEGNSRSCPRCETWICENCLVEGMCHNCFSKLQGGVN